MMADIPNSVKPKSCHNKKRIHNGKCEDQSTGFIFVVSSFATVNKMIM